MAFHRRAEAAPVECRSGKSHCMSTRVAAASPGKSGVSPAMTRPIIEPRTMAMIMSKPVAWPMNRFFEADDYDGDDEDHGRTQGHLPDRHLRSAAARASD